MIQAGVNVVRLNFSHGSAQDHIDRAALVRQASKMVGREVAIMADLQGPKVRVGKFANGKILLEMGQSFVLDASRTELGDENGVGLDYKELPRDVKKGDTLLLNDGLIVLTVEKVVGEQVHTSVALLLRQQAWVNALRQYLQLLAGAAEVEGVQLDAADTPLVQ